MARTTHRGMPSGPTIRGRVVGTFVLVFGGCGSAVIFHGVPDVGIGLLGVFPLAFRFRRSWALRMVRTDFGLFISDPAVTAGRRPPDVSPRVTFRLRRGATVGALLASAVCLPLHRAKEQPGGHDAAVGSLAANGYGARSPGRLRLGAALVARSQCSTFIFLTVILGSTSWRAAERLRPRICPSASPLATLVPASSASPDERLASTPRAPAPRLSRR